MIDREMEAHFSESGQSLLDRLRRIVDINLRKF